MPTCIFGGLAQGTLRAIVVVSTNNETHGPEHYRHLFTRLSSLSHVSVEKRYH